MIFGVGTDIVEVARIRRIVDRFGERFASRILSPGEIAAYRVCRRPVPFLAKHFAAKEAMVKALGTGFGNGVRAREIAVVHASSGQPLIDCCGRTRMIIKEMGVGQAFLSIADEDAYAIAFVTLQKNCKATSNR